jgi:tetratricopeptide (TPR) repeat protein
VADLGTSVPVDVFDTAEALAFLDGRTGLADDAGAAALAAALGYLPLALDQAAAVIIEQHLGYRVYLARLRLLPVEEYLVHRPGQPYPRGVAEAVLLSLEAVRAFDRPGVGTRTLEITAMLAPTGVRREIVQAAAQAGVLAFSGHRVAATAVDRALAQLAGRSLLTFSLDGQTIVMHGLVTQLIRDWAVCRGQMTAVCRAAALALEARARALVGSQDRLAVRDLPQQVAVLVDLTSELVADIDDELARALRRLRLLALYHLIQLGDSAPQAVMAGQQLTEDLERVLGADHPDTLNARNSLAAAYQLAGQPAEAIPLYELTLAGRERVLGPDHPDTVTSLNNLATAYRDAGRVAEAIPLFGLALAGRERMLGVDDPGTLNLRGNLAAAYRDAGRAAEAIPLFEQTLAGRERLLGPDHPDTLRSRNNLASAYKDAGRLMEAIPLVEQVLTARERILGPDDPATLASRNNLAAAYLAAGRAGEAIPLFEQNVAACERLFGAGHPRTLASRHHLDRARQESAQA